MRSGLHQDLVPVGLLEEMMVGKIAVTWWRLNRVLLFEVAAICRASQEELGIVVDSPSDEDLLELLAAMQAKEVQGQAEEANVHVYGVVMTDRREEVLSQ